MHVWWQIVTVRKFSGVIFSFQKIINQFTIIKQSINQYSFFGISFVWFAECGLWSSCFYMLVECYSLHTHLFLLTYILYIFYRVIQKQTKLYISINKHFIWNNFVFHFHEQGACYVTFHVFFWTCMKVETWNKIRKEVVLCIDRVVSFIL